MPDRDCGGTGQRCFAIPLLEFAYSLSQKWNALVRHDRQSAISRHHGQDLVGIDLLGIMAIALRPHQNTRRSECARARSTACIDRLFAI